MYSYLLYLTKNWAVAEDLTSETFETALKKWRRFDPRRGDAARGCSRSLARPRSTGSVPTRAGESARSGPRCPSAATSQARSAKRSPRSSRRRCALSAGEREVVALRIVLDLDGEETARLLGISVTAVSTRLSRALSKLEERMRDHDVVA